MIVALDVIAALLVSVLVAVLVVPILVDVDLDTARAEDPLRVHVRWLGVSWQSGRPERRRKAREKTPARPRRHRTRRRRARLASALAAVRTPGFPGRCLRLVREQLHAVMPADLRLHVRAGLDDPAATGELYGAVCAATGWITPRRWDIRFEPDFEGLSLAGEGTCRWRVRPGALLWPVASFAVAPVVWRAAWAAWRSR